MTESLPRRGFLGTMFTTAALVTGIVLPAQAAKPDKNLPKNIKLVPTITGITMSNGQMVAYGTASAVVKGKTVNAGFFNVPVHLEVADDQTGAMPGCPILDLGLDPIRLNLLGLIVQTSSICLKITAIPGGGLLGDLLCGVANLLQGGLNLDQILAGTGILGVPASAGVAEVVAVPAVDASGLLTSLTNLLNGALAQLLNAELMDITKLKKGRICAILHLELGPVALNLLGLAVNLDDCNGGPVVVDISAQKGALLGDLLCALVGGSKLPPLALLSGIIRRLQK